MLALVDLRRRRQEVELRDVADQHDVEQPVVGRRVRCELHAAAVPHAVRDDHVVHAAAPLAVVERHRHLGVLPLEEHARQRIEERRLAAERLRHPVRALRDGAAHPDRADVRELALGLLAAPTCGSGRGPRRSCAASPSSATRTASSNFVGMP